MCELQKYCWRVIRRGKNFSCSFYLFHPFSAYPKLLLFFFFFFPFNWFSLYGTSPAPPTNFTSYVPMTGSSLTPPASSVATPAVSASPQLPAGSPWWTQPSSPRYHPYTVAHPGASAAAATPRSLSISIPSSSPSAPAVAAGPPAMAALPSRHRPSATGPPVFAASPGALRRRPSFQSRIPPRYCTRAECVCCVLCRVWHQPAGWKSFCLCSAHPTHSQLISVFGFVLIPWLANQVSLTCLCAFEVWCNYFKGSNMVLISSSSWIHSS